MFSQFPYLYDEEIKNIRVKETTSLDEYDLLIFHGAVSAYLMREIKKPKILYNHTCHREATFEYSETVKYLLPLDVLYNEKVMSKMIAVLSEGYRSVDVLLTNSMFTKRMLKEYFDVDSEVVYPPVDREIFYPGVKRKREYFLSVQRIDPVSKRVELQLEIFKELPHEELIIVGPGKKGYMLNELVYDIPNITYLGKVSQEALVELYRNAKATIQMGTEVFGLVPIESLACGTPAIVVDAGGFQETIIEDVGIRVKKPWVENFIKTIQSFDGSGYDPQKLYDYTERFSQKRYQKTMRMKADEAIRRFNLIN